MSAPSHQERDQERAAVRLAAQAAAGALGSVCPCTNIVICPTSLQHSQQVGLPIRMVCSCCRHVSHAQSPCQPLQRACESMAIAC